MRVRCPQCGAEVDWQRSPARPFCSERCRLIDLSAWIEERYAIPGEPFDDTLDSASEALRNDDESGRD